MKLINLTLELTNKCNLKCAMCSIWEEKDKKELSLTSISNFFNNSKIQYPIGSVSLTGGEVFLHSKIDSIYRYLYLMKKEKKLAAIDIVTNGYFTGGIIDFLKNNISYLDGLEIDFSIDGLEKNHNFQRGMKDAWQKTWSTINHIKNNYPQVGITVKYTINRKNIDDLISVSRLCKEKGIGFLPKFIEKDNVLYYHRIPKSNSLFNIPKESVDKAIESLRQITSEEKDPQKVILLNKMIESINKDNIKSCRTPEFSLFVTCYGKIHPCIYMTPIGTADGDLNECIDSNVHNELIIRGKNANCNKCHAYHGFLRSFNFKD